MRRRQIFAEIARQRPTVVIQVTQEAMQLAARAVAERNAQIARDMEAMKASLAEVAPKRRGRPRKAS